MGVDHFRTACPLQMLVTFCLRAGMGGQSELPFVLTIAATFHGSTLLVIYDPTP